MTQKFPPSVFGRPQQRDCSPHKLFLWLALVSYGGLSSPRPPGHTFFCAKESMQRKLTEQLLRIEDWLLPIFNSREVEYLFFALRGFFVSMSSSLGCLSGADLSLAMTETKLGFLRQLD